MIPINRHNTASLHKAPGRALWLRVLFFYCLVTFNLAAAPGDTLLIIHDNNSELTTDIIHTLSQQLATSSLRYDTIDLSADALTENTLWDKYTAIVTLGSQAAEIVLKNNPPVPSLSLLISKQSWLTLKKENGSPARSVLLLDQPVDRQLKLIRKLFGEDSSIGIILGPYSSSLEPELTVAARQQRLEILVRKIQHADELIPALNSVTEEVDLLLAEPDSVVYNKRTIQGILLLTYRNKTPVIGFSQAYSRAGAMASLYSDAEDLARQTTEILLALPSNENIYYPKYFTISFNQQVARTLGISTPDEKMLIEIISQTEKPR